MLDCTDVIIPKLTTVSKYLRVRAYDLRHTGVQFFHQYCKTRGVLDVHVDVDVIVPHRTASGCFRAVIAGTSSRSFAGD